MLAMIEKEQYNRLMVLVELYRITNGDRRKAVQLNKLGSEHGVKNGAFDRAYDFLMNEGLISAHGGGYTCTISHEGIKLVEDAVQNPHTATRHFAPLAELGITI
jgi:hypothetical protein